MKDRQLGIQRQSLTKYSFGFLLFLLILDLGLRLQGDSFQVVRLRH